MLFQSSVPALFEKIGFALEATANRERKEEQAKRIDFYHGEQLVRLEEQLNILFSDPSKMVLVELNIIKKIILCLAQVYREPPKRTIEGTDSDKELYQLMTEQCSLDIKLKQASRYTKLLKTILVRPVWRNNHLDIDIMTGNIVDVQTGDVPEDLKKVLITDYGASEKIEDIQYSLWTAEIYQRLNYKGNIIEEQANPYKVLPFIPFFDYMPTGSGFWLNGGSDLIGMQEAINIKLTDLVYLIQQQSFGVGYIKGSQGAGNMRVDPGSLAELPENGEIGFVSQNAEIKEVLEAIDKLIKWTGVTNGLSAGILSTDPTEQSGVSKIVDSKELSEMRSDDISFFRSYEKKLFNLMRIIWNKHNTKKLSDSAILRIDFADQQTKGSPVEQATTNDLLMNMGVITPVDIVMERNPDLRTREDALAFLLQLEEERKALNITI